MVARLHGARDRTILGEIEGRRLPGPLRGRANLGGRGMRYILVLLALLGLVACASKVNWTKPGVTAEQLEKDKASCTKEVPKAAGGGAGSTPTTYRVQQLQPKCMEALGYTRG